MGKFPLLQPALLPNKPQTKPAMSTWTKLIKNKKLTTMVSNCLTTKNQMPSEGRIYLYHILTSFCYIPNHCLYSFPQHVKILEDVRKSLCTLTGITCLLWSLIYHIFKFHFYSLKFAVIKKMMRELNSENTCHNSIQYCVLFC